MSAAIAPELVRRYAELTEAIKTCKQGIGAALELCPGVKGHRHEVETPIPCIMGGKAFVFGPSQSKRAIDDVTHLSEWYRPITDKDGETGWTEVTPEHALECPHCYAAHLLTQDRKAQRRRLSTVKAQITKAGKLPAADPAIARLHRMAAIGEEACLFVAAEQAITEAKRNLKDAYVAWKDMHGLEYVTRDTPEWAQMLADTKLVFDAVFKAKRLRYNTSRRLHTAATR